MSTPYLYTEGADLCLPHALKHRRFVRAEEIGQFITAAFNNEFLSACDLNYALARLYSAIAQGLVTPKTAKPLAYLAQTMIQSIPLARQECISVYGADNLERALADSFEKQEEPALRSTPDSACNAVAAPASGTVLLPDRSSLPPSRCS